MGPGLIGNELPSSLGVAVLEMLFGAMLDAVCIAGSDGIVYANAEAQQLLGIPGDDLTGLGERLASLRGADGEPLAPEARPRARAQRGESAEGLRLLLPRAGGEEPLDVAVAYAPVGGPGCGAIVMLRDRTLEARIERTRDDFLASVAHDLRSPLTAIRGAAQLALRRVQRGDLDAVALENALRTVDSAGERLNRILDTMLDGARLERGDLAVQCAPTDLVALVEEVVEFYRQGDKKHQFVVEASNERVIGNWDAALLQRVLENLVSNAVKYSLGGGEIAVTCIAEGDAVRLSVRDQGLGIAAVELPHIFERFYRVKSTALGEIEGTGVGLFAVRGIIMAHGGSIDVLSVERRWW